MVCWSNIYGDNARDFINFPCQNFSVRETIVKTSLFSIACRVSHSGRRKTAIFDFLEILISLVLVTATDKLSAILLENPLAWILILLGTTCWPVEEKHRLSYTQESIALWMAWKNNKELYSKSRNVCKGNKTRRTKFTILTYLNLKGCFTLLAKELTFLLYSFLRFAYQIFVS